MEVFLNRESVAKIRPMEPTRDPSLVRLMLLRGALVGGALAALFDLLFHDAALGAAVAGLILGAIFSGTAAIEEWSRRARSRWRALVGAFLSGLFALTCCVLAVFQVPYTVVAMRTGSLERALGVIEEVSDRFEEHALTYIAISLMLSPIFAVETWRRVRGVGENGRVPLALALTPFLCAPGFLMFALSVSNQRDTPTVAMALTGCLVAIPFLLELADFLERRLAGPET